MGYGFVAIIPVVIFACFVWHPVALFALRGDSRDLGIDVGEDSSDGDTAN